MLRMQPRSMYRRYSALIAASNGKAPFQWHSSDDIWLQVVCTSKNDRHPRLPAQPY